MTESFKPQEENLLSETATKALYAYFDKNSNPIFKTMEVDKLRAKILVFPYFPNRRSDTVTQPKIKRIEFHGWESLAELPVDYKSKRATKTYYGLRSTAMKQLLMYLRPKFPGLEKIIITKNGQNRFSPKTMTIKHQDLFDLLRAIKREKTAYDRNRKHVISEQLAKLSSRFSLERRPIIGGELTTFMRKYRSFEKLSESDVVELSRLFEILPKSKISVTSNFIETRNKINIAYLEDIVEEFEKLLRVKTDNEKQWQAFFAKHAWVFSHLFAYEVILKNKEAYVGGKTISNSDGRIVDFLYQNGFQDNFALIEIKTHKKTLLKNTAYRAPAVFAMSDDLSGGINQCLDQKDTFIKHFGKEEKIIDPKCILLVGMKADLSKVQRDCFELLRNNQKNVDIVTFDEILLKIKGLLKVIRQ